MGKQQLSLDSFSLTYIKAALAKIKFSHFSYIWHRHRFPSDYEKINLNLILFEQSAL